MTSRNVHLDIAGIAADASNSLVISTSKADYTVPAKVSTHQSIPTVTDHTMTTESPAVYLSASSWNAIDISTYVSKEEVCRIYADLAEKVLNQEMRIRELEEKLKNV